MVDVGDSITQDLSLVNISTKESIKLNELWNEGAIIIKMFRRFGCAMCKYEAVELSNYKSEFDRLNVKLVGVGFSDIGVEPWIENGYWKGDLFLDEKREVYNMFEAISQTSFKFLQSVTSPFTYAALIPALTKGYSNDPRGDLKQLGATYVIGKGGKILYKFLQTGPTQYPDIKEIVQVVGGNYDSVEKSTGVAPESCSSDVKPAE